CAEIGERMTFPLPGPDFAALATAERDAPEGRAGPLLIVVDERAVARPAWHRVDEALSLRDLLDRAALHRCDEDLHVAGVAEPEERHPRSVRRNPRKDRLGPPFDDHALRASVDLARAQGRLVANVRVDQRPAIARERRLEILAGADGQRLRHTAARAHTPQRAAAAAHRTENEETAIFRPHRSASFGQVMGHLTRRAACPRPDP